MHRGGRHQGFSGKIADRNQRGHSLHGRDQSASEEMYGCADFLSAGTPEAVSGSRAKRLNPEYFETSEDKPCSDP